MAVFMAVLPLTHTQTFLYGFTEARTNLREKKLVLLAGAAIAAGIGYLVAGSLAAVTSAKIALSLLAIYYGLGGHPDMVLGINTMTQRVIRQLGNTVAISILPLVSIPALNCLL